MAPIARPAPGPPAREALAPPAGELGVWAVTLWAAGRAPLLVGLGPGGVGLSQLGRIVRAEWRALGRRYRGIALGEYAVLPDRLRALLHVAGGRPRLERAVASFTARVARTAGAEAGRLWEPGLEASLLLGPEELERWRRLIRAAAAGIFPGGRMPD